VAWRVFTVQRGTDGGFPDGPGNLGRRWIILCRAALQYRLFAARVYEYE